MKSKSLRLYEVSIHAHGRRMVRRGPAEGLLNWPEHKWTCITPRPIGLRRATELADQQGAHAVVCVWGTSEKVYDNGRRPYVPEGWWPPEAECALAPRANAAREVR